MKAKYSIYVKGKSGKRFSFSFISDTECEQLWEDEGFEVDQVYNTIPLLVKRLGLTHIWVWLQDKGVISY